MVDVALSLLVLKTHKINEVRDFYETLGLLFIEEKHGTGPIHFACDAGEIVFEIYPLAENETVDTTTRLGFRVGDLAFVLEALERRKLCQRKEAKPSEWGLRAVVKDPDGRSVELYQFRGE